MRQQIQFYRKNRSSQRVFVRPLCHIHTITRVEWIESDGTDPKRWFIWTPIYINDIMGFVPYDLVCM